MKTKAIAFFMACSFLSCKPGLPDKKPSYVHSVIDSLKIDKSKNILIYTINPNDCINCLVGFVALNNTLSTTPIPKVYVLSIEREIEKDQAIKSMKNIDLRDTVNKVVLWNKEIYIGINETVSLKKAISLSALTIYNYQKDTVIYNKPIKEITGIEEFKTYLE
ncbi:MAG: hypothetical protein H0W84_11370, partial [Bacteroidetes bacterium]|nr:hypothetical protein [Bacteroidota bacterium]